jgi:hypothetical protein
VKVTLAIWPTGMAWAASRTICARRQVTTEPLLWPTIRSSRFPSESVIGRSSTCLATGPRLPDPIFRPSPKDKNQPQQVFQLFDPSRANIA